MTNNTEHIGNEGNTTRSNDVQRIRRFQCPDGKVMEMTEEEFQNVVSVFATLAKWRDEQALNAK